MKYDLASIDETINDNREGSEVGEIISKIRETVFSLHSKEEITIYVQNHQIALLKQKEASNEPTRFDKILFYLETYFWNHLNGSLLISDLGKEALFLRFQTSIDQCNNLCFIREDNKLQILINLLNPQNSSYTIDRANYMIEFWECWASDFMIFNDKIGVDCLINFLITQNFNAPSFYKYIISKITESLENEADPKIQEVHLETFQRKYCHVTPRIKFEYSKNFPHIYDRINNWILQEIKLCRKKQKEYNPDQTSILRNNSDIIPKIETSLSVPQVACLVKMFNASGIFTNQVQKELLESVSRIFKAKKAESIAFGSLYNKYYNVEDKTKESVIEILEQVIKENK